MPPRPRPAADPGHDALFRAVCAAPRDDLPRLVLADYLEERGRGDDHDRALAIRLQVRLAGLQEWDDGFTETALDADNVIRRNLKAWTAHIPRWEHVRLSGRWSSSRPADGFVGGYPGSVQLYAGLVYTGLTDAVGANPIADVVVGDVAGMPAEDSLGTATLFPAARVSLNTTNSTTVRAFAAGPAPGLREVSLNLHGHGPEAVRDLLLPAAAELCLNGMSREVAAAVPGVARPVRLEQLHLYADLHGDTAGRLAADGWADGLRHLTVALDGPGGQAGPLVRAAGTAGLRSLGLWNSDVNTSAGHGAAGPGELDEFVIQAHNPDPGLSADAVRALAGGRTARVRRLALPRFADADASLALLARRSGLRVLKLHGDGATAAGFAALARGQAAGSLRRLVMSDVGPESFRGLCDGPVWLELAAMVLDTQFDRPPLNLDGSSVAALIDGPNFPRLTSLDAGGTSGAADLWRRLAKSDAVAKFRRLRLAFPVTDAELNALLDNPAVRAVGHLALPVRHGLTAKTRRRFEKAFGVPVTAD